MLGFYADPIREVLGVPSELKLLLGISFGYLDATAFDSTGAVPHGRPP
ncbi:MAG: hypothetical protein JWR11_3501 [Mycobacterium sp.]|jgi:hypothetical protein|nr:hypothetical protein [Mycobacterium sp.]MDT5067466.1 hypothetical protein [Mycobacterium sp.]